MDADTFRDLHWMLDVIQSADIGVVVLDETLRIEVFNHFMQAHSGLAPESVIGRDIRQVFPELPGDWLERHVDMVFELGAPIHTHWEQRPWLFRFPLHLPLRFEAEVMYQNTVFLPLRAANKRVERVGILVHDVTDMALQRQHLEAVQQELLNLSRTDALTGLWSRGYWDECLEREWQRSRRQRQSACLMMLDIDHFKRINDELGHPAGDEALRWLASILHDYTRKVDVCGRYGGEEFAVILPGTTVEGALQMAERLRREVARASIDVGAEQPLGLTVSIGIATTSGQEGDALDWLRRADDALYQAKEQGRNRCSVA